MRNKYLFLLAVVAFSLMLMGCEGKEGPVGPAGPGSRTVYSGTIIAAAVESGQLISVPKFNPSNFPLIAVYIGEGDEWLQLNTILYDHNDNSYVFFEIAVLLDGEIVLFVSPGNVGMQYKIVVVT